jgi:hypothetical protein
MLCILHCTQYVQYSINKIYTFSTIYHSILYIHNALCISCILPSILHIMIHILYIYYLIYNMQLLHILHIVTCAYILHCLLQNLLVIKKNLIIYLYLYLYFGNNIYQFEMYSQTKNNSETTRALLSIDILFAFQAGSLV